MTASKTQAGPIPPGAFDEVEIQPIEVPLAGGDEIRRLGIAAMFDHQVVRLTFPNFDGCEQLQAVLPDAQGHFPDSNTVDLEFQRTVTSDGRPLDDHEAYLDADHIDLVAVKKFGIKLITRTNGHVHRTGALKPCKF
jgi:hypothetical protein